MEWILSEKSPYIAAGRYNAIPAAECKGIARSLCSLIDVSSDDDYVYDALLRLGALTQRLGVA